jgi:hypothetical protein
MKSSTTLLCGTLFGLSLALASAGPALGKSGADLLAPAMGEAPAILVAQADIDFGDDSSRWANDGECDDPRFAGPGAAAELVDADLMKDATDCEAAYDAGTVTLAGEGGDAGANADTANAGEIDFGDDTSQWANDGECDDPRFTGPGAAAELVDADLMKDATDCRAAFEAGTVTVAGEAGDTQAAGVDFGDDSSEWANDGECDDPRFEGTGMAVELLDADIMKDATDCRTLFEAGSITLKSGGETTATADVDFGDDSSQWANDGECDDPRFEGTGMAAELVEADLMKDATDCRALYEAGSITLRSSGTTDTIGTAADIDFGDDSSTWANDGECDDPRFTGPGAAAELVDVDLMHDATDCRAAYEAGTVTLRSSETGSVGGFYFGDDSSQWANDGECDDRRLTGAGTDKKLLAEDEARDATDCRTLLEAGSVEIRKVYDPAYAAGAPYDSAGIDFGDNTSTYANDGECDDPRFEGPGTAMTLLGSDELRDADDCRTAFEAGTVVLREG